MYTIGDTVQLNKLEDGIQYGNLGSRLGWLSEATLLIIDIEATSRGVYYFAKLLNNDKHDSVVIINKEMIKNKI